MVLLFFMLESSTKEAGGRKFIPAPTKLPTMFGDEGGESLASVDGRGSAHMITMEKLP